MGMDFESLVGEVRPKLARAFSAAYGLERGEEALGESLAYAWEHRYELLEMENPAGYLYRVGQSRTRRRRRARLPTAADVDLPDIEPALVPALESLTERQRICVGLVVGHRMSQSEVADLLGISKSSVQNHVERGMTRLRRELGVHDDAST
jgi:DNA-directed RNA polymerase specialized sigma24 family protein